MTCVMPSTHRKHLFCNSCVNVAKQMFGLTIVAQFAYDNRVALVIVHLEQFLDAEQSVVVVVHDGEVFPSGRSHDVDQRMRQDVRIRVEVDATRAARGRMVPARLDVRDLLGVAYGLDDGRGHCGARPEDSDAACGLVECL